MVYPVGLPVSFVIGQLKTSQWWAFQNQPVNLWSYFPFSSFISPALSVFQPVAFPRDLDQLRSDQEPVYQDVAGVGLVLAAHCRGIAGKPGDCGPLCQVGRHGGFKPSHSAHRVASRPGQPMRAFGGCDFCQTGRWLPAALIWHYLLAEHGFAGGYDTAKQLICRLDLKTTLPKRVEGFLNYDPRLSQSAHHCDVSLTVGLKGITFAPPLRPPLVRMASVMRCIGALNLSALWPIYPLVTSLDCLWFNNILRE